MSPKCQVHIVLNNMSVEKIRAIREAIEPDNVNFPEGLDLNITNNNDRLILDFQSMGQTGSLIGTVDEILGHIQVALRVIE